MSESVYTYSTVRVINSLDLFNGPPIPAKGDLKTGIKMLDEKYLSLFLLGAKLIAHYHP